MELTQQCIEEIVFTSRKVNNGKVVITVVSRPEDSQNFDFFCEFKEQFRVTRNGRQEIPTKNTAKKDPWDKFS
jgi:hypothetical protein